MTAAGGVEHGRELAQLRYGLSTQQVVKRKPGMQAKRRMQIYSDGYILTLLEFFFSSRRRHTRLQGDWSSDVCSSDLRLDRPFALGCNQISDRSQERKDDRGGRRVRGNLLHDGPDSGRDEGNREQGGRDGRKAQTNRSRTTPAPRLEQQQTGGQRLDPDEGAQRDEGERGHR